MALWCAPERTAEVWAESESGPNAIRLDSFEERSCFANVLTSAASDRSFLSYLRYDRRAPVGIDRVAVEAGLLDSCGLDAAAALAAGLEPANDSEEAEKIANFCAWGDRNRPGSDPAEAISLFTNDIAALQGADLPLWMGADVAVYVAYADAAIVHIGQTGQSFDEALSDITLEESSGTYGEAIGPLVDYRNQYCR